MTEELKRMYKLAGLINENADNSNGVHINGKKVNVKSIEIDGVEEFSQVTTDDWVYYEFPYSATVGVLSTNFYNNEQVELDIDYIIKHIPKDKFIICYAGTINKNNPLEAFIEAANLLKNDTSIHFLILGNGNLN